MSEAGKLDKNERARWRRKSVMLRRRYYEVVSALGFIVQESPRLWRHEDVLNCANDLREFWENQQ